MAQKTFYVCDGCNIVIGEKRHISIMVNGGSWSGIANPPGRNGYTTWQTEPRLRGGLMNFHDDKCIARYFRTLMGKDKKPKK